MPGNTFQVPSVQPGKFNDSWSKGDDNKNGGNQFKTFSTPSIDSSSTRVVTEPNLQGNIGKPLSNSLGTSHQSYNGGFNQQNGANQFSGVNQGSSKVGGN
jgi:hypothetical protein